MIESAAKQDLANASTIANSMEGTYYWLINDIIQCLI